MYLQKYRKIYFMSFILKIFYSNFIYLKVYDKDFLIEDNARSMILDLVYFLGKVTNILYIFFNVYDIKKYKKYAFYYPIENFSLKLNCTNL